MHIVNSMCLSAWIAPIAKWTENLVVMWIRWVHQVYCHKAKLKEGGESLGLLAGLMYGCPEERNQSSTWSLPSIPGRGLCYRMLSA